MTDSGERTKLDVIGVLQRFEIAGGLHTLFDRRGALRRERIDRMVAGRAGELLGWFVARNAVPTRPSLRDAAIHRAMEAYVADAGHSGTDGLARPPFACVLLSSVPNAVGNTITQDLHIFAGEGHGDASSSVLQDMVFGETGPLHAWPVRVRNMGRSLASEYGQFQALSQGADMDLRGRSAAILDASFHHSDGLHHAVSDMVQELLDMVPEVSRSLYAVQEQEQRVQRLRHRLSRQKDGLKATGTLAELKSETCPSDANVSEGYLSDLLSSVVSPVLENETTEAHSK